MKYLKGYKLFEQTLVDEDEEDLVARSDEWSLYKFKTVGDFVAFDMKVSPNEPLTKGAFSSGRHKQNTDFIDSLAGLFNQYQSRFGDLFLLINSDDIKQLYMFNCGEGTFYGIFNYTGNTKSPMTQEIAKILESLDYTDSKIEWWIKDVIDRELPFFKR